MGGGLGLSKSKKKKVKENTGIQREIKNKSKSESKPEIERGGEIAERRYRERAFGGYLVIVFIIQVHDFNFPLFLSKAGGAAGGRLVVSWITAYEMNCSALSQCLDDIIGMVPRRTEYPLAHSDFLFQPPKTRNQALFTIFFFTSPIFSHPPKHIHSHSEKDNMLV